MVELRDQSFWVSGRGRWLVGSVRSVAVGGQAGRGVWVCGLVLPACLCLSASEEQERRAWHPCTARVGKKTGNGNNLAGLGKLLLGPVGTGQKGEGGGQAWQGRCDLDLGNGKRWAHT